MSIVDTEVDPARQQAISPNPDIHNQFSIFILAPFSIAWNFLKGIFHGMENLNDLALLDVAKDAARSAGTFALENRHRVSEVNEASRHDLKLQLDRDSQAVAESVIRKAYPEHSIIGEEYSDAEPVDSEWIIDPIDGTINFFHGLSAWCCAVAMRHEGTILAAAVYMPETDEMFTASTTSPAQVNGTGIATRPVKTLDDTMLLYGLGKPKDLYAEPAQLLLHLSNQVRVVRVMGSAAVDMCMVACGRSDAYIDNGIFLWDYAAAGFIAEKAGAEVIVGQADEDGRQEVLCASRGISEALQEAFKTVRGSKISD